MHIGRRGTRETEKLGAKKPGVSYESGSYLGGWDLNRTWNSARGRAGARAGRVNIKRDPPGVTWTGKEVEFLLLIPASLPSCPRLSTWGVGRPSSAALCLYYTFIRSPTLFVRRFYPSQPETQQNFSTETLRLRFTLCQTTIQCDCQSADILQGRWIHTLERRTTYTNAIVLSLVV